MRVIKTANYEMMSLVAADIIISQVLVEPDSVLGLATGSTPLGIYGILASRCAGKSLDFKAVRTVNLDEYVGLPADHEQSYARFMRENLFDKINIDLSNTHLPNGMAQDLEAECAGYDALIKELGGIDLQLLGIGHNGHIGFNEPGDIFPAGTHREELTQSTQQANSRLFDSIDDVPTHALTMGIGDIMRAKRILVAVNGEGKAQAVKDMLTGPITPQMPASILQLHPDCILVADEAALSLVSDLIN